MYTFVLLLGRSSTYTVTQQSTAEVISTSSANQSQLPGSSTVLEEGEQSGPTSTVILLSVPVIAGIVVAFVFLIVLVMLVLLALGCCKMKASKRYTIDSMSKQNGELAQVMVLTLFHYLRISTPFSLCR